ncbi:MAG: MBL fold metallo-hydrolase [Nitrososphaerota archaeon]|nr:MBL fold metallo-hydrolase [Nitrososphaerota archaeon]
MDVERIMPGMGVRSNVGTMGAAGVTLVRDDVKVLVDTGHYGTRDWLKAELERRKVSPADIDVVVLTHLHWDHCLNVEMFPQARILLGEDELKEGFLMEPGQPQNEAFKAALREMKVETVGDGDRISSHATALLTPGHSPGHVAVALKGDDGRLTVMSGDAVPNYRAYLRGFPDISFHDRKQSEESVKKLKDLRPDLVIPGHDSPFNDGGYVERDDFTLILRRENEENSTFTFRHVPADRPIIHR